jgi:hypothetical protein
LTISLSSIKEAKPLYQSTLGIFLFEIVLKTEYEKIHLISSVEQHIMKNAKGGFGYSPRRLASVPIQEMLSRVMPGSSQKNGNFVSHDFQVSLLENDEYQV